MILLEARPWKYLHMVEVSNQETDFQHQILTVWAVELEFAHDTWILLLSCCWISSQWAHCCHVWTIVSFAVNRCDWILENKAWNGTRPEARKDCSSPRCPSGQDHAELGNSREARQLRGVSPGGPVLCCVNGRNAIREPWSTTPGPVAQLWLGREHLETREFSFRREWLLWKKDVW